MGNIRGLICLRGAQVSFLRISLSNEPFEDYDKNVNQITNSLR